MHPWRARRAAVLLITAVMLVGFPHTSSSQVKLTDGWWIFPFEGRTYNIPPNHTPRIIPLPDGSFLVFIVPEFPPPLIAGGPAIASRSPATRTAVPGLQTAAQRSAQTITPHPPSQLEISRAEHALSEVAGASRTLVNPREPFPRQALLPYSSTRALDRLESDFTLIQSALLELAVTQRFSGADFNRIRSAAFRIRDYLPSLIAATGAEPGTHGPASESTRQEALTVIEHLIRNLEIVLPILDQVSDQANTM
jgi:hypothetical protein